MAYTAGNLLGLVNAPPGRMIYRYDTTDHPDAVEAANYFNNLTDTLNLQKGALIHCITWSAVDTGTISYYKLFVVTNVIANNAAANAGAVNLAVVGSSTAGAVSSLT